MPGLTSSLNIGLTGLQASQAALNVIGHNISNVNTPGYSRQRAVLSTNLSQQFGTLSFGMGVNLANIMGIRDRFLDMQITESISRQKGANVRYEGLEGISSVFNDQTEAGLNAQIQAFFNAFTELSKMPENGGLRTNLVGTAQTMVSGLQTRYQMLKEQRDAADGAIGSIAQQVNSLTSQIAALNDRISTEPSQGSDNDARDQRKALVDQLGELVGVQVFEDDHSRMNISLSGGAGALVSGSTAYTMTTVQDPANMNYLRVQVSAGSAAPMDVTQLVKDGELGARLDLRDNLLAGYQRQLDQLAAGIVSTVNLQHRSGYALDGVTQGTDFFQGALANGANGLPASVLPANNYLGMVNAMSVNAAVVANPGLIAAAGAAGAPGDNSNARALASLLNQTNSVDTNGDGVGDAGSFTSVVSSLVNTMGTDAQGFRIRSTNDDNLITALQTQRDRVSGVDMDEEATNLISFQRGYQASARFISVINQLTDQLVNQFGQ